MKFIVDGDSEYFWQCGNRMQAVARRLRVGRLDLPCKLATGFTVVGIDSERRMGNA